MSETTTRLLSLLSLLQARSVWSGTELARRLDVTERCVRRDITRLRELGYPVQASRGVGGGYQLSAGRALPPLLLDRDEAVAVAVSLRIGASGSVTGVSEAAIRTLAKVEQMLPKTLAAEVASLQAATTSLDPTVRAWAVAPDALLQFARAIRDSRQVRFSYTTPSGVGTDRRAEPYQLVVSKGRWYLLAYDLDRDDWRSFRIDRMHDVTASTFGFRQRPDVPDPDEMLGNKRTTAWPVTARIVIHAPLKDVAADLSRWGELTAHGEYAELVTGSRSVEQLAQGLLWIDWDFHIPDAPGTDNAALRAHYAVIARRTQALART